MKSRDLKNLWLRLAGLAQEVALAVKRWIWLGDAAKAAYLLPLRSVASLCFDHGYSWARRFATRALRLAPLCFASRIYGFAFEPTSKAIP